MEDIILSNLIFNEEYARRTIAFIKPEYFTDTVHRTVFDIVSQHINNYNVLPSPDVIKVELSNKDGLSEKVYLDASEYVERIGAPDEASLDWLVDQSEKFCRGRAIYNALMESVRIVDENGKSNIAVGAIPKLLEDAIGVSFNTSIGHDYFLDAEERYDFYHRKEEKIPFDLHYFNEITKGGVSKKTLNVIMASTGVGKSMVMCHMAAGNLARGSNVLYITLEMAKERIAQRIDVNLLNLTFDELQLISKAQFTNRLKAVWDKTPGRLVIEEYAPASASVATFRNLLNELKLKRNFIPDIIYVDYLNLTLSVRIKSGSDANSYTYIKNVAEELRGLAVEQNLPIISATQTNRGGFANSDIDLNDTSESFGLPMTVDFMVALIVDEELEKLGQIIVKQLKSRYDDINKLRRFIIGVDKSKMKLYDVETTAQENLMDGPYGWGDADEHKYDKDKFQDLT